MSLMRGENSQPPKVLLQLDGDPQPSAFDSIVAVDAGIDHLLRYHGVAPEAVRDLVHGAIFTRGGPDLARTAIFIGGADVEVGAELLQRVTDAFIGPLRVSVMLDPRGANTTAAAAVLAVAQHVPLAGAVVVVLGGTGPVGRRVARLMAWQRAQVRVASRRAERADEVCRMVRSRLPDAAVTGHVTGHVADGPERIGELVGDATVVVAAGAAGVELLPDDVRRACSAVKVVVDLNAVPPLGIGGVEVTDKAICRDDMLCYGAIGVGGAKMKIHKAALARLFEDNQQVLDAEQIYQIGEKTGKRKKKDEG